MKTGSGITTTLVPLLREDGRLHFAYPKPLSVRLLEAALAVLWFLAATVVVTATVLWV